MFGASPTLDPMALHSMSRGGMDMGMGMGMGAGGGMQAYQQPMPQATAYGGVGFGLSGMSPMGPTTGGAAPGMGMGMGPGQGMSMMGTPMGGGPMQAMPSMGHMAGMGLGGIGGMAQMHMNPLAMRGMGSMGGMGMGMHGMGMPGMGMPGMGGGMGAGMGMGTGLVLALSLSSHPSMLPDDRYSPLFVGFVCGPEACWRRDKGAQTPVTAFLGRVDAGHACPTPTPPSNMSQLTSAQRMRGQRTSLSRCGLVSSLPAQSPTSEIPLTAPAEPPLMPSFLWRRHLCCHRTSLSHYCLYS